MYFLLYVFHSEIFSRTSYSPLNVGTCQDLENASEKEEKPSDQQPLFFEDVLAISLDILHHFYILPNNNASY